MDCHEANKQIDLRLQESCEGEPPPGRDWSALDLHLADCVACASEWDERAGVRHLLADVRTDSPTEKETDAMWATINGTLYAPTPITSEGSRRANIFRFARFAAGGVGIAACLAVAMLIGQQKTHTTFTEISSGLPEMYAPAQLGSNHSNYGRQTGRGATYDIAATGALSSQSPINVNGPIGTTTLKSPPTSSDWTDGVSTPDTPRKYPARSGEFRPGTSLGARFKSSAKHGGAGNVSDGTDASNQFAVRNTSPDDLARLLKETADANFPLLKGKSGRSDTMAMLSDGVYQSGDDAPHADRPARSGNSARHTPEPQPQLKLIRTGDLSIEVQSYESAVEQVTKIVHQNGGFLAGAATRETTGGANEGQVVIRVSPQRFDALFAALKAVGRVISENAKTADVTAEYVDLDARIHSLQITEARLQELVKSKSIIDKVSALLEVEKEMTRVRAQIEQLQGKQRVMSDRVAMSTITVTLREPPRSIPKASFWLEVPVLDDAVKQLASTLEALGGTMESGQITASELGSLKGEHNLKITVSRFAELVTAIESVGRVKDRIIRDWEFNQTTPPWAETVRCVVFVQVMERSWQLPSGQMHLEVEDLPAALDALNEALKGAEGAVERSATTRNQDGSSQANVQVQSPAGRFSELVAAMTSLGRVTGKSISGEAGQIVGGAARTPCSLKLTLVEPARQQPTAAIALEVSSFNNAQKILADLIDGDTVRVLSSSTNQRTDGTWTGTFGLAVKVSAMKRVVEHIESLGSVESRQITGLGIANPSQVDPEATGGIALALGEKPTIAPGSARAGDTIRGKLREGIAGLYESVGLIAYGLMVLAPWLVITLLVSWLVARCWRPKTRS